MVRAGAAAAVEQSGNDDMAHAQFQDQDITKVPHILPHERVFPIQIGGDLFKLSGASLSSDAPSYFSQYFFCQLQAAADEGIDGNRPVKTLYIDRDPATFRDIALHLQGYHIQPRDGTHFVRLFADAQFYSLPKLISQLYDESIFISIGHREFQIPRSVFNDPGNTPNYFSLGFAVFFSNPDELFPGLDRDGLIRPPSILPPAVPSRSAAVFAELLQLLQGYPVNIRNETHRQELLRDARYFHFKGLEQRLIPHSISYNQLRRRDEITLRLENIQKSGVGVGQHGQAQLHHHQQQGGVSRDDDHLAASSIWINYARPYVDERPSELILEIGGEDTKIHFNAMGPGGPGPRAEFFRDTKARVARLFEVIATKLNLPPTTQPLGLLMASGGAGSQPATPGNTPLSEDLVRVAIEPETAITLDGKELVGGGASTEVAELLASAGAGAGYYTLDSPASSSAASVVASNNNNISSGSSSNNNNSSNPRKRRRADGSTVGGSGPEEWIVRTGQWRLRIQGARGGKSSVECVLVAVKLDAMSSELGRNVARPFLL
jgi:hypothetical protein